MAAPTASWLQQTVAFARLNAAQQHSIIGRRFPLLNNTHLLKPLKNGQSSPRGERGRMYVRVRSPFAWNNTHLIYFNFS